MDVSEARTILGICQDATLEEARAAYRRQTKLLHPDRWAAESDQQRQTATEMTGRLNAAWSVLQRSLSAEERPRTHAPSSDPAPSARPPEETAAPRRAGSRPRRTGLLVALGLIVVIAAVLISRQSSPPSAASPTEPTPLPSSQDAVPLVGTTPASAGPAAPLWSPVADNPIVAEVWGSNTVPFPSPASTSYPNQGLVQRSAGGVGVLVPSDWAFADESIPSDHDDLLFYDPANPAARLEISGSGCVGCITNAQGQADPRLVLPQHTVQSFVFNHGRSAGFRENDADGYAVNGIVTVLTTPQGQPAGYELVRVVLPGADTALATAILNSISTS